MDEPLVSVIIVNWNGRKYLDDCLGSLARDTYKNKEILFVDNASSDDSVGYVKKYYPHFILILNNRNLGYAEGHEIAIKKANGKFILLLSMDTIVEKNSLTELIKTIRLSNNIGAVQPKLLMYPQKHMIDSIGAFFLMTGILYHYGREKDPNKPIYNKSMEIFSAKGACLLFRKEALAKTGLFDKDYFAYFEETDLCHRIWLAGYRIIYSPYAVVYHKGGGSSKQMMPSFIYFHSYKNRICTYIKNLSFKYLVVVLFYTLFMYELATIIYLLRRKFHNALAVQQAIIWNIVNLKKTLEKRKYIQTKIRVKKDDEFLPQLIKPVHFRYYYNIMFGGLKTYRD